MAYIEIRREGRLVSRRAVDEEQARRGCRIRLGEGDKVRLTIGQSQTVGKYQITLFEGNPPEDGEAVVEGLGEGAQAMATETQEVTVAPEDHAQRPKRTSPYPVIEGYEIIGRLGQGGMGTVWKATELSTKREVAIKFLGRHRFDSDKAKARFEREVALAAKLTHPNVARVYASGLHRGVYYYVMELIDGIHLDNYVQQQDLSDRDILKLMAQVCDAVRHAHSLGIVHRDLKPSNILVSKDGQPHIVDFGLARMASKEDYDLTISVEGEIAGTPAYMAPEQAAGRQEQISERTDVYGLGVILYQLLTGHLPHEMKGGRYDVLKRIVEEEIKSPCQYNERIDRELEALILTALAREPEMRYPSAAVLQQDIENYLKGEPLLARSLSSVYRLRKRVGRQVHRYRMHALVACVFVGVLALVYLITQVQIKAERQKRIHAEDTVRQMAAGGPNQMGGPSPLARSTQADDRSPATGLQQAVGKWRLGVQAYTFNRFTFCEAVAKTKSLGLKYIEAYPQQMVGDSHGNVRFRDMDPALRQEVRQMLKDQGVTLVNYGLVPLPNDEAECRKAFDFARDMKIETIVSEPPDEAMVLIDRLCEEYRIGVAIHNRPKSMSYCWDPGMVLRLCEGRSKWIGACADIGHWTRSGIDAVEAVRKLGSAGRIRSVHFKDLNEFGNEKAHDVIWGTGVSRAREVLAELAKQGYEGTFSIEYEYNWLDSLPEITGCVGFFRETAAALAGRSPSDVSTPAPVPPVQSPPTPSPEVGDGADRPAGGLADGLVLYFSFDQPPVNGQVSDLSGKGNHGVVEGAQWAPDGKIGGAFRFVASHKTERIRVPHRDSLDCQHITLAAWIKSSDNDGYWNRIIDNDVETTGFCLSLGGTYQGRSWKGQVGLEWHEQYIYSRRVIADGTWHHVAASYDGTTARLYLDGVPGPSKQATAAILPNRLDIAIGNSPPGYGTQLQPFDGLIDEVMIFNRALTTDEIKSLAARAEALPAKAPSLTSSSGAPAGNSSEVQVGDSDQRIELAVPKAPMVWPKQPRRMLVFDLCGPGGYKHTSIPYWDEALRIMGAKTRAFEVTISSDMAVFSPDTLKAYDAVCFNNTTKLVFTEEQKKALMDFVRSGKGIVGIHAATDSFYGWDEAARMMGGQFTKHPWTSDKTVTVKIDDPANPLTKPFGGKRFRITDEIYATHPPFYGRDKQRVLMSLDMSDPSTRNVKGVTPQDYDTGISWIKRYGQGRVFYGALGHNHPICWNPAIMAHYLAGIQFALGDLEADATPSH